MTDTRTSGRADVLLGEDWVGLDGAVEKEIKKNRERRVVISLNRSPLARKIITFNLLAILFLVAGVLFLNPFRDSLVFQREAGLLTEVELIVDVVEARLGSSDDPLVQQDRPQIEGILRSISLRDGVDIFVFGQGADIVATERGEDREVQTAAMRQPEEGLTIITSFLSSLWDFMSTTLSPEQPKPDAAAVAEQLRALAISTAELGPQIVHGRDAEGRTNFMAAAPIAIDNKMVGVVALQSAEGEIDALVRHEREQVLQMFVVAAVVSVGLSLLLASTIANPLSDLAAAAELGRDKNARKMNPGRVRIPDLTARPDEIGRLSGALRGMIAALYNRIDANEQFAADVSHEIKNPLASLRSAVGTLRVAKKPEHREKLLEVIEHDVRRLDRLVSDISNASRLDSELVKEEEEAFDLLRMIDHVSSHLRQEASQKGIEFITDLPKDPIVMQGLEPRLAQVFVNLITNAISFCEEGDAIRVWARKRENRVLVVVEDTGPGIPEGALHKIFNRFYSERPEGQFGNNSGLGLAISKQIVEAHGGVIWAENIRHADADTSSDPLGARFVVGLPV